MPETSNFKPETHDTPANWDDVFGRVELLGIPEDVHDRAEDFARHFTTGMDIEMFGKALHDVLVPDVDSSPVDYPMKAVNPSDGEVSKVFKQPEERSKVFQDAADYVGKLAAMRQSPDDDQAFLSRVAHVVALAIGQAHSYQNGNGRLSRFIAELVREGTANRDDLKILGTERDVSQKQMNGFRVFSYLQRYQSVDRGETDEDVLSIAASTDIPLSDIQEYQDRASSTFSVSSGY